VERNREHLPEAIFPICIAAVSSGAEGWNGIASGIGEAARDVSVPERLKLRRATRLDKMQRPSKV